MTVFLWGTTCTGPPWLAAGDYYTAVVQSGKPLREEKIGGPVNILILNAF